MIQYQQVRFRISRYFMDAVATKKSKTKKGSRKKSSKSSSENATTTSECVFLRCAQQSHHTKAIIIQPQPCLLENPTMFNADKTSTKVMSTCFLPPKMMEEPTDFANEIPHPGNTTNTIYVKPLIVLDLNGILCRRVRGDQRDLLQVHLPPDSTEPLLQRNFYRPSSAYVAGTPIISRTDLPQFLPYLDTHFTLAVWTSAKLKTAKLLVKTLFPIDIATRLLFIWGQNRCEQKKHTDDEVESCTTLNSQDSLMTDGNQEDKVVPIVSSNHHPKDTIFIKSLAKVWNEFPLWDSSNTLLIDDSPEKCPPAHLKNTIHPPPIVGFDSSVVVDAQILPDEVNQERQLMFFQQLTEIWIEESGLQSKGSKDHKLYQFLQEYGRGHMGWRG